MGMFDHFRYDEAMPDGFQSTKPYQVKHEFDFILFRLNADKMLLRSKWSVSASQVDTVLDSDMSPLDYTGDMDLAPAFSDEIPDNRQYRLSFVNGRMTNVEVVRDA